MSVATEDDNLPSYRYPLHSHLLRGPCSSLSGSSVGTHLFADASGGLLGGLAIKQLLVQMVGVFIGSLILPPSWSLLRIDGTHRHLPVSLRQEQIPPRSVRPF